MGYRGVSGSARGVRLTALAALLSLFIASPAAADWLRAESPRFIVHSDGDARVLREYVQKLETFDTLLRAIHGLPTTETPERKLPIYLVGNQRDIQFIRPGSGDNIAGFYRASDEDIFAVAIRTRGDDSTLLHEYVHHFMLQNFSAAYPGWLVEGYADYFSTTEFGLRHIAVGKPDENRVIWLGYEDWLPIEDVLTKAPFEMRNGEDQAMYYAQSWLMAHYFLSNQERQAELKAYVAAVGAGSDPLAAMELATGLPVQTFSRRLRDHFRSSVTYTNYRADLFPPATVTVSNLGTAESDLMMLSRRLVTGTRVEDRAGTAEEVRRVAARHPADPFARLTLAHAELHFGDRTEGIRLFEALVTDHPGNVEALQYLADSRLDDAVNAEDPAPLLAEARRLLGRAFELDPTQYRTYLLLARSRQSAANYPTDNDIDTWQLAYSLAPQLTEVRIGAARALISRGRFQEAINLLEPVAHDPHGRGRATAAAQMIAIAEAGQTPPDALDAEIEAADSEPESDPTPSPND